LARKSKYITRRYVVRADCFRMNKHLKEVVDNLFLSRFEVRGEEGVQGGGASRLLTLTLTNCMLCVFALSETPLRGRSGSGSVSCDLPEPE